MLEEIGVEVEDTHDNMIKATRKGTMVVPTSRW